MIKVSIPKGTNWKQFKGEELPESANKWAEENNIWRSGRAGWIEAFYEGNDAKAATNWIIVTDDGSYYKVHAVFSVWGSGRMMCAWSVSSMGKMVRSFMTGVRFFDPGYTT